MTSPRTELEEALQAASIKEKWWLHPCLAWGQHRANRDIQIEYLPGFSPDPKLKWVVRISHKVVNCMANAAEAVANATEEAGRRPGQK